MPPRVYFRPLLAFALCATQLHGQAANPGKAEQAYLDGVRAASRKDLSTALAQFLRASQLDPAHTDYTLALSLTRDQRIRELVGQAARARMLDHPDQAEALLAQARAIDPASPLVQQHAQAMSLPPDDIALPRLPVFAGPIELAPNPGAQDLHLRGDAQQVLTQAASTFGIKALFDEPVSGPPIRFDLDQTTYEQAMPLLLRMAHMFAVPLDPHSMLVARDSQDNRARLERQLQETVLIPGSTTEQLNEYTNIIKNVFDIKQVITAPSSGTLVIRAPELTLQSVNYTLANLVDGPADIVLRLQLLSVDKTHTINTGAQTPNSVGVFSVASEAQNIVSGNQAAVQTLISSGGYVPTGNYARDIIAEALILVLSGAVQDAAINGLFEKLGGGLTLLGVTYTGTSAFNLALNSSEARALEDISLRVGDRQQSVLRLGSKYPITTSTYSSGLSSATASALAGKTINGVPVSSLLAQASSIATVPMVQYEDLGITLKADAAVQKSGLVQVKVDLKIEALTGSSANNIPVLTSRAFVSNLSLENGSTAILLSDLSSTEAASISGLPGLAELPGFQQSVADKLKQTASSELVLLITPHIVRRRSDATQSRRIAFSTSVPQDN